MSNINSPESFAKQQRAAVVAPAGYGKTELIAKMGDNAPWQVQRITYFNTILFLPIFLVRKLSNLFGLRRDSDFDMNANLINKLLKNIFLFEIWMLKKIPLPIGVSLLLVARKK